MAGSYLSSDRKEAHQVSSNDPYSKLISAVELDRIELLHLEHKRNHELHPPFTVSTDLQTSLRNYQDEEIIALAEFTLEGTSAETNNSELRIHMIWQLGYSIDRQESSFEMSENLINRFIERNVAINIWPYTRELVASLTAKMSLTPLVLPTLKVLR